MWHGFVVGGKDYTTTPSTKTLPCEITHYMGVKRKYNLVVVYRLQPLFRCSTCAGGHKSMVVQKWLSHCWADWRLQNFVAETLTAAHQHCITTKFTRTLMQMCGLLNPWCRCTSRALTTSACTSMYTPPAYLNILSNCDFSPGWLEANNGLWITKGETYHSCNAQLLQETSQPPLLLCG